jgi:DNA repair protein RadC
LTLIELLSLVLGTPNDPMPAAHLLAELKTLAAIRARTINQLAALAHGITASRAQRLLAALELGERLHLPDEPKPIVRSPADAVALLPDMALLEQEEMRVMVLDTKNNVLEVQTVYRGSVHTTIIRISELLKPAVRCNATGIVVAHNHPSGDPTPSPEDVAVTREIRQAAQLLDVELLDHVVIGTGGRFVSLKERGLGFT